MNTFTIKNIKAHAFGSVEELIDFADSRKGILVALNAEKCMYAKPDLVDVINSNIGYCDGAGPVKVAHRKGYKNAVRTPGCELWLHIIERHHSGRKFYLVGSTTEVVEAVVEKLRNQYPDIQIVGHRNGFFADGDEERLAADLERTRPDFVFVAMGSPRQELLMQRLQKHHVAVYQGLGGSFDLYVGNFKRAPKFLQKLGCEWIWRFIAQPARIRRLGPYLRFARALYLNRL
ncbi:MAG: WecB/TagA/CpsF family glycosyltransferase [Bacteroides sp.]|nr:WecB/TagA/CpsF family glycosyltransferase [Bacteroides sp.]MCM1379269.1 WecB/TagA/CpsF family glycosyltransferase [Bacteroides sp.]MCM1445073.1 WecB/TagA/CpsF family glycosyltransferase [Prevotella sp.]